MGKSTKLTFLASAAMIIILAFTNIQPADSKAGTNANEAASFNPSQPNGGNPKKPSFVPDVVILEVKQGVSLTGDTSESTGRRYATNSSLLDSTLSSLGISSVAPLLTGGQANALQSSVVLQAL